MKDLLNRDECWNIVQKSDAFECKESEIQGFKIQMYNYLLAGYSDFNVNDAFEMRGLCFIQDKSGNWERNLLLTKFFNLNQTQDWMYEDVQDKNVVRVQDKFDGSIISFVKLPNGETRAKSKMSFESDQAKMAQELYNNSEYLQDALKFAYHSNQVLIFELISPMNQIVLNYEKTELILLQVRGCDGSYLNDVMTFYNNAFELKIAEELPLMSLEKMLELKETEKDIEGWIVTLEDGQMMKIKTDWYLELHGLIGPDALRENLLIQSIVNESIDDVIAQINDGFKKDFIIDIQDKVNKIFNSLIKEFKSLRCKFFNEYNEDRKSFAIKYSKEMIFPLVMKSLSDESDIDEKAKELVKNFI